MKALSLDEVIALINEAIVTDNLPQAEHLLHPALDQHHKHPQLWFIAGNIEQKKQHWGAARIFYERSISLFEHASVYANLGAACRRMNDVEAALKYLLRAIELDPKNETALNNLAASYVNEGKPLRGIEWAKKCIEANPQSHKARWNMGLMQLEAGDFENGFRNYRAGIAAGERMLRSYAKEDQTPLLEADSLPAWQKFRMEHGRKPILCVWGEQGIGDEIMFASILWDASQDFEIVYECHPRLESMIKYSMVSHRIYGTRKERVIQWPIDDKIFPEVKCPIGDLAVIYRQSRESFRCHEGYLRIPVDLRIKTRDWLRSLAEQHSGRKIVGFAWSGGIVKTNLAYRSMRLEQLKALISDPRIFPICLQYEDATAEIEALGISMAYPRAALEHFDYAHTAAIVAHCDAVVSVNTSIVHLAGALAVPTYVLTPSRPAWRYGVEGKEMVWYPGTHKQYRQTGQDWEPALAELKTDLEREILQ